MEPPPAARAVEISLELTMHMVHRDINLSAAASIPDCRRITDPPAPG